MDVKAIATRVINKRGNQVLTVTGQVDSNTTQPVLPAGQDYLVNILECHTRGGSVYFSFEVEAAAPVKKIDVPVLPSELTRQEQEEVYLKQMLNDPNLDDASIQSIRQRLGWSPLTPEELRWRKQDASSV